MKKLIRKLFITCIGTLSFASLDGAILNETFDLKQLQGEKLGYYIGSFDPIHLGHQHVIETALKEHHVDYVLVYPAPGGDTFKNRTDLPYRQKMISSVYATHPRVLLTHWTPKQLQDEFESIENDLTVVGIIGSDVILEKFYGPDQELGKKYLKVFMRGIRLSKKHFEDTAGALMALKASSFLVARRGEVDLEFLNDQLHDRPISGYIDSREDSSTRVRNAIAEGHPIDSLVAPTVEAIIWEEQLYQLP